LVLFDGQAGAVGCPREVELDGPELELRLHRAVLNLVPRRAQSNLLRYVQHAIHRTKLVATDDHAAIEQPGQTESLGSYAARRDGIDGNTQRCGLTGRGIRYPLQRVASLLEGRLQLAQREPQQGRIRRGNRDFGGWERCVAQKQRRGEPFKLREEVFHRGTVYSTMNLVGLHGVSAVDFAATRALPINGGAVG
jgi:hypothetical protein